MDDLWILDWSFTPLPPRPQSSHPHSGKDCTRWHFPDPLCLMVHSAPVFREGSVMADAGDGGQRCEPVPRGLLSGRGEPQLAAELASAPSAAKVGVAARLSWYVSAVTQDPDGPQSGAGTPPRCANQGVHRRDPNEQRRGLWAPEPGRIPRLITALTLGGSGSSGSTRRACETRSALCRQKGKSSHNLPLSLQNMTVPGPPKGH